MRLVGDGNCATCKFSTFCLPGGGGNVPGIDQFKTYLRCKSCGDFWDLPRQRNLELIHVGRLCTGMESAAMQWSGYMDLCPHCHARNMESGMAYERVCQATGIYAPDMMIVWIDGGLRGKYPVLRESGFGGKGV